MNNTSVSLMIDTLEGDHGDREHAEKRRELP